ncbi:hypothetical protein GCM10011383_37120 [Hymenobacter cavernae]|uniref:STAS/SEC14 domain-containing protein n=1 Tax=Hymenobacter cavernae TaxID=2044852 RepID=A0ABQ1ULM2_9BACT|nr:hypothetical protein GCM10011383_37120 [Hymenobacter cavernae]
MLVYSNKTGTLRADQEGKYLHLTWNEGIREDYQIQEMFSHVLRYIQETGWHKILINQRWMQPASVEVELWFRTNWLPRAVAAIGTCRAAIVVGQDVFTRLVTVSLMRESSLAISSVSELQYCLFQREETALRWLLNDSQTDCSEGIG